MPRTKLPVPKEAAIQRAGIAWMRAQGALVFRRNTGAFSGTHNGKRRFVRFSEPGMADTWGLIPNKEPQRLWVDREWRDFPGWPRFFECEFKRPGARPSASQIAWLRKVNDIGAAAWWVDNLDTLERVYRWVASGGRIEFIGDSGDYDLS